MVTGQSLLNMMEVLHPELQNQPGEADVAKSLIALNMAQDFLESLLAQYPNVYGSSSGTLTTTANTETTTFPVGVLRIDLMQLLGSDGRPTATLDPLGVGEQTTARWPLSLAFGASGGPQGYDTNGTVIYWSPVPDAVYSVRWRGFKGAADLTASGAFAYADLCMGPLAALACRIIRTGLDDAAGDLKGLAGDLFTEALATLTNFQRQQAPGFAYTRRHTT